MELIACVLVAVVFRFIFSDGRERVDDFLAMFILDFLAMFILVLSLVALAYWAFWLMGQLAT